MACLLSNGRALECRESIGGIRNIYFVNHNDMGAYTIDVDGELDDLGATSSTYKYELNPQGSDFAEAITASEENGTVFYEQTLNLTLPNLSKDALKNLKILAQGRYKKSQHQKHAHAKEGKNGMNPYHDGWKCCPTASTKLVHDFNDAPCISLHY